MVSDPSLSSVCTHFDGLCINCRKEEADSLSKQMAGLPPECVRVYFLQVCHLFLMAGENLKHPHWPLARVHKVFIEDDGLVRTVELKTKGGLKLRPINKLALLEGIN